MTRTNIQAFLGQTILKTEKILKPKNHYFKCTEIESNSDKNYFSLKGSLLSNKPRYLHVYACLCKLVSTHFATKNTLMIILYEILLFLHILKEFYFAQ